MNISIKEMDERHVAYVTYVGNYMGNTEIFKTLFGNLAAWAGPKELLSSDTVFLSSYQDDPHVTPPEDLILEVCMEVSEDVEVEGEIQKKTLPGGEYAVLNIEVSGADEYGPAWNSVVEWSQEKGYTVDMSRPSYEIYLNNPEEHPEGHHIIDICLSVKK